MTVYLTDSVAQRIVSRAMAITQYNINVMDCTGIIIGSGDPDRLYSVHEGALKVLEAGEAFDIDHQKVIQLKRTQMGINRPIRYQQQIVGVVGITGDPAEVSVYADMVVMTAELMIENASLLAEMHWHQHQRESLVLDLINGMSMTDERVQLRAEQLNLDLHTPRDVVLVNLGRAARQSHSLVDGIRQWLNHYCPADMMAMVSSEQLVILHQSEPHHAVADFTHRLLTCLREQGADNVKLAVSYSDLDLSGSWQCARELLQLGLQKCPEQSVYWPEPLMMDALLRSSRHHWSAQYLRASVQPLFASGSYEPLIRTLHQYVIHHADSAMTVKAMHIHRNTLGYRLDKIQQLTGFNPRKFNELLVLYCGLSLAEWKDCAPA